MNSSLVKTVYGAFYGKGRFSRANCLLFRFLFDFFMMYMNSMISRILKSLQWAPVVLGSLWLSTASQVIELCI